MILSFSLRINIKTICDRTVGSDTISSIHGLKAVSMIWVILGHTCIIGFKYSGSLSTFASSLFQVHTFVFVFRQYGVQTRCTERVLFPNDNERCF